MRAPHVVIFEPEASGHEMGHLRSVLAEIRREAPTFRVTLLTRPATVEHPNFRKAVADFADLVTVHAQAPSPQRGRLPGAIGRFNAYRTENARLASEGLRAIGVETIDFVLILMAEGIGFAPLAFRRICLGLPWGTVSVSTRFHHRAVGIAGTGWLESALQRLLFARILADRSLACFASVNPFLREVCQDAKLVYSPVPAYLPPTGPPGVARRFYGVREGSFVVLAYGSLTRRKNIDLLFEAVALVDPAIDITILLAGRQHPSFASVMAHPAVAQLRAQGRLIEANRFIMDGIDAEPLEASDLVWIHYLPHFVNASGVLVRAGQAGVPAMARDIGLIGRLVNDIGCGVTLANATARDIAAALEKLAHDPVARAAMGEKGRTAFAGHTHQAYAAPIVAAIKRAVALRSAQARP